jgi:hypothetical protein
MIVQILPLRLVLAAILRPFARSKYMLALLNMNVFLATQNIPSAVVTGFVAFLAIILSVVI